MKFEEEKSINYEMVYCIAVYHDIVHHIDAINHEVLSTKILSEDESLKSFVAIYTTNVFDVNISTYMINRNLYKTNDKIEHLKLK